MLLAAIHHSGMTFEKQTDDARTANLTTLEQAYSIRRAKEQAYRGLE